MKDDNSKESGRIPFCVIAVIALVLGIAIIAYVLYMQVKPRNVDPKVENCIYLSEEVPCG